MRFISTRGSSKNLSFDEVILAGLADDGGLYVPESLPEISNSVWEKWRKLDYSDLAVEVMWPFVEGSIPREIFIKMVSDSYSGFRHTTIAPLKQIGRNQWLLELFHGPTLAFKDFALQLLGRLLDYFLSKNGEKGIILGATSGDTGSAAIHGCKFSKYLQIVILHPHERVSSIQRKQMTTVSAKNVFNLAVEGNFDDCQAIVKGVFLNRSCVLPKRLLAINSINLARIMAQTVYYVYASLGFGSCRDPLTFSVPSANFGDAFGGYLASKMGLPVSGFIVATNTNDALVRAFNGDLSRGPLISSLSPSMDIVVSSNFERLLFDLSNRDSTRIKKLMESFASGPVRLPDSIVKKASEMFRSMSVDDHKTIETIIRIFKQTGECIDPHTATAVAASEKINMGQRVINLATAHPSKFPEAICRAGLKPVDLPSDMEALHRMEEKFQIIQANQHAVENFLVNCS